jgi:hypothetical protein
VAASNNTPVQLAQYALNIAIAEQQQFLLGQVESPSKGGIVTILGILALLAEAIIVDNNTGVTGGGTIPNAILTGKYSSTASATAPIQV